MPVASAAQLAAALHAAGARGEGLVTGVAVALAESGGRTDAVGVNSGPGIAKGYAGSRDRGPWQINDRAHPDVSDAEAFDLQASARHAYRISSGATNWRPWSTYNGGQYRAHVPAARAAASSLSSAGGTPDAPAAPAETGPVYRPPAFPLPPGPDELGYGTPISDVGRVRILGRGWILDLAANVLGSPSVDLSAQEVPELTLTIADDNLRHWQTGSFALGLPVDLGDLRLEIAAHELVQTEAGPAVRLTCRDRLVEILRRTPAPSLGPLSPSGYVAHVVKAAGGYADVIGTYAGRDLIEGEEVDADPTYWTQTGKIREQAWDVVMRIAEEEGVWVITPGNMTLRMGRPSDLVNQSIDVWISHGKAGRPDPPPRGPGGSLPIEFYQSNGIPTCRYSKDPHPHKTVTCQLPRYRGERVRPGMRLNIDGVAGFEPYVPIPGHVTLGYLANAFLVDRVTFDLGSLDDVTVEASIPVDPQPALDESTTSADTSNPAAGGPSQAAGSPTPGTRSALDFVSFCLRQVGDVYRYGAEVRLDDPDPDEFDCSELIQWACAQCGVQFVDGSSAQIGAVRAAGLALPVAEAARIRGAVLWKPGHIGVSLGDGTNTVEAMGRAYGVKQGTVGSRWVEGGRIPGLNYGGSPASRGLRPVSGAF